MRYLFCVLQNEFVIFLKAFKFFRTFLHFWKYQFRKQNRITVKLFQSPGKFPSVIWNLVARTIPNVALIIQEIEKKFLNVNKIAKLHMDSVKSINSFLKKKGKVRKGKDHLLGIVFYQYADNFSALLLCKINVLDIYDIYDFFLFGQIDKNRKTNIVTSQYNSLALL